MKCYGCFWNPQLKVRRDFNIYLWSKYTLLMDHTNYVLCKGLKIYNRNMLTRSSQRIFNPMHYTGDNNNQGTEIEGKTERWIKSETFLTLYIIIPINTPLMYISWSLGIYHMVYIYMIYQHSANIVSISWITLML